MPAAFLFFSVAMTFLYSSSVKGTASEESSSLIGDNLGHLGFVGISPRPLTSSWCVTWLAVTRQGGFEVVGSLEIFLIVVVVYPLPWPLLVGGVRCSRLWSTSQLLRPSGQQYSHSGGVCPQIQGRQCGAYVGAVEEMMCVVCVDVTEGA